MNQTKMVGLARFAYSHQIPARLSQAVYASTSLLLCQSHKLTTNQIQPVSPFRSGVVRPSSFLIDLAIYLSLMFLIREFYFSSVSFIINGLFWSLATLAFATWRMKARGSSWSDVGLRKPKKIKTTIAATLAILGMAIGFMIVFQVLIDQLKPGLSPDTSNDTTMNKFGNLKNNWLLFLSIVIAIWLEACIKEMLDRGFLINWIESIFSGGLFATVLAVVFRR